MIVMSSMCTLLNFLLGRKESRATKLSLIAKAKKQTEFVALVVKCS